MESHNTSYQNADPERSREFQLQSLEVKNHELTEKLEKLRIATRTEINLEREQHKKTFFEMARLHKQNSELQARLEHLEASMPSKSKDASIKKGRPSSVDTRTQQRHSYKEASAGQNSGKAKLPKGNRKVESLKNSLKENKGKSGYHERLSVDTFGRTRSGLSSVQGHGPDLSSKSFDYHNIEDEGNEIFETFRDTRHNKSFVNEGHNKSVILKAERSRTDVSPITATGDKGAENQEEHRILREIMRIYGVRKLPDLIPSIRKTEKVMQTVPKLQELLKEIADMVIPRVGDMIEKEQQGMKRITMGVKHLCHEWDKKEKSKDLKRKLARVLTLEENCKNSEIVHTVEELKMVLKQFLVGQPRRDNRVDDSMHHLESSVLSQGAKSDQAALKDLNSQFENLKYYLELLKQKLNMDPNTKIETCLGYTLKFIDGVAKDRQAIETLNYVQNILKCEREEVVTKVTDLARQKQKAHGPYKHAMGYT